jgi:gamma-glutamyl-gamma-aminobutyrate hydrolase PuuD
MAIRVALATRNEDKSEPYRRALQAAGLEPVTLEPDTGGSLESLSGLVLTGGTDVDPALYGATPLPETDQPDRKRDDFESLLLRSALARDVPVLAICRGLQLFNVVCGGTLIQHLPGTEKHKRRTGGEPVHEVVAEGRMAEVFGATQVPVNSRHHQAIDRLGDGMVITARDPEDGVIEGFDYPGARFALGVQWHPEDMVADEHQRRLFEAFAASLMAR